MQVNALSKKFGALTINIDPKIVEEGSPALKKGIQEATAEMLKHAELYKISITKSREDRASIYVERSKSIGKGFLFGLFKPTVKGKGEAYIFDINKGNSKEGALVRDTFKKALTDCNKNLASNFEKKFGTQQERKIKYPNKYAEKIAKQNKWAEKISKTQLEFNEFRLNKHLENK